MLIVGDLERKVFEQANRYDLVDSFVKNRAGGVATIGGLQVYGGGDFAGTPPLAIASLRDRKRKKQQLVNRFVPRSNYVKA